MMVEAQWSGLDTAASYGTMAIRIDIICGVHLQMCEWRPRFSTGKTMYITCSTFNLLAGREGK